MNRLLYACLLMSSFVLATDAQDLPAAAQMKTLGLIGGTSWYSTVEYYRYINKAVNDAYSNNTNPPLVLYSLNQEKIHELQSRDDWDGIVAIYLAAVARLRASGADAILFCANTPHKVYGEMAQKTDIPILHIADATGVAIRERGLKKVGLIGTLYTMEGGFIADWLKEHYGVETIVPASAGARRELHRIIQELSVGRQEPQSKAYVLGQIEELRQRGGEGIVLGCTEFPLMIKQRDLSIPVFDTTLLHSQMAVDFILGRKGAARVHSIE